MSTSDIIYDKRFRRGTFGGHKVEVPDDKFKLMTEQRHWAVWDPDLLPGVKAWLLQYGPWRNNEKTFYFARASTAALFKLQYC
jgi:hypothetical protein